MCRAWLRVLVLLSAAAHDWCSRSPLTASIPPFPAADGPKRGYAARRAKRSRDGTDDAGGKKKKSRKARRATIGCALSLRCPHPLLNWGGPLLFLSPAPQSWHMRFLTSLFDVHLFSLPCLLSILPLPVLRRTRLGMAEATLSTQTSPWERAMRRRTRRMRRAFALFIRICTVPSFQPPPSLSPSVILSPSAFSAFRCLLSAHLHTRRFFTRDANAA